MYQPLVSIIIPVYNGSNYLAEAIESALAQTYRPLEIIVVNDGSRDDGASERVAKSYGDKIRYFPKNNGGVSSALNVGIKNMQGEWFSWLSHDDLYYPDKIKRQIQEINERLNHKAVQKPDDFVLYTAGELVDKDGKLLYRFNPNKSVFRDKKEWILGNIKRNYLGGCSFLVPRSAFDQVGGFAESIRTISDYDMWYRLALAGYEMVYIKDVLVKGRVHGSQTTFTASAIGARENDQFHIDLIGKLSNMPEYNTYDMMYNLGYYTRRRRLMKAATQAFDRARKLRPGMMTYLRIKAIGIFCDGYYWSRYTMKQAFLKFRALR